MNRTKIEWTDYTWNPIVGCRRNCFYCYARKIAMRFYGSFEPRMFWNRLDEPAEVKKPSKIFVCSMGEMFGDWVPMGWTNAILDAITKSHWHTFQILTKQPQNLNFFTYPPNVWLGITIDGLESQEIMEKDLDCLLDTGAMIKFVSFEPLLGEVKLDLDGVQWIIIGARTNPEKQPKKEWVQRLIDEARSHNIPIFLKNNLKWPIRIQEFPE